MNSGAPASVCVKKGGGSAASFFRNLSCLFFYAVTFDTGRLSVAVFDFDSLIDVSGHRSVSVPDTAHKHLQTSVQIYANTQAK